MNDNTPISVSVVVPVWNAEKYLEKCIDSILGQSYPNIELILVDDGSTDSSGEICDRCTSEHRSVQVIHKKNGGPSSARNAGIEIAGGDYIVFVDSDDSISEDCIRLMVENAASTGAEYVKSRFVYGGKISDAADETIDVRDEKRFLPVLRRVFTSCGTLMKRDIISENHILFDETLKCSEDAVFLRQFFRYCTKVSTVSGAYYYCFIDNSRSVSKRFYPDYACYHRKKLDILAQLFKALNYSEKTSDSFLCERAYWGMMNTIIHGKKHELSRQEFYDYMERSVTALYPYLVIDAKIENQSVNSWKNLYYSSVRTKNIGRICRYAAIEGALRSMAQSLKKPVKMILRRT